MIRPLAFWFPSSFVIRNSDFAKSLHIQKLIRAKELLAKVRPGGKIVIASSTGLLQVGHLRGNKLRGGARFVLAGIAQIGQLPGATDCCLDWVDLSR